MTDITFKRKYRWTFSANFPGGEIKEQFCKIKNKPSLEIIEKENSDGSFLIEKQAWAPLVTTFFDATTPDGFTDLYSLLAKFYEFGSYLFTTNDPSQKLEGIKDKLGTGKLIMYDGCGVPQEQWNMLNMWPHSINFGDLCYSSSADIDIEITWRYKDCKYINLLAGSHT